MIKPMKTKFVYFGVLIFTLIVGILTFYVFSFLINQSRSSAKLPSELQNRETTPNQKQVARFEGTGHGCDGLNYYGGRGSGSGYQINDGRNLSSESSCQNSIKKSRDEFNQRIGEASQIIELKENETAEFEITEDSVIEFGRIRRINPKCLDIMIAPNRELATEFETWIDSIQYRPSK
jgi:hypothetical protein